MDKCGEKCITWLKIKYLTCSSVFAQKLLEFNNFTKETLSNKNNKINFQNFHLHT
ncbi:unnamed protein product [Moneuplotes crassus]|uniref:Uncharacterized protein n=1 Tax=Euplotes crassus TaxID=5936 RepID=A0AAD1X2E6_EUPCR|nr:unnamed protein product [Moneuplotes crassus]